MKLIRPFAVTEAALLYTDVEEDDAPEWGAEDNYSEGQSVMLTTDYHKVYLSLQNANTGNHPASSPEWWVEVGPTNKWALFDRKIGTQTTWGDSFTYTIQCTGRVDSCIFMNAEATEIQVEVLDETDTVQYDETYNMVSNSGINNWYAYYFEDIKLRTTLAVLDLPAFLNPKLRVTVRYPAGTAKLGAMIPGRQKYVGRTQYGASVGIIDYSKKDTDDFGNFIIVERPFSNRGNFQVMVDNQLVDEVHVLLAGYRSTPIVYIGSDCFGCMILYGFYKDFDIVVQHHSESQCSLQVESLT